MLRTLSSYIKHEVWPRRAPIVLSSQALLSVLAGFAFYLWGKHLESGQTDLTDILTVVLAYGAIAFGISLAGLTVALTLPNDRFTTLLATVEPPTAKGRFAGIRRRFARLDANAYSDLLFVFSWTALIHWLLIALGFGLLVARGGAAHLLGDSPNLATKISAAALALITIYAVCQFLVVVVTISQVGRTYVGFVKRDENAQKDDQEAPSTELGENP